MWEKFIEPFFKGMSFAGGFFVIVFAIIGLSVCILASLGVFSKRKKN